MITYCTTDDLTPTWLATTPPNAPALMRAATLLVAYAAGRNPYVDAPPIQDANNPEYQALRDATCAQVAAWVTAGIDPTSGVAGEAAPLKRSDLFEGKIEYDTAARAAARVAAIKDLCHEAHLILEVAGLLFVAVPRFDTSGYLDTWGLDVPDRTLYAPPDPQPVRTIVAFTPQNVTNVTQISGAPVNIPSSTTSVQLTLGKQHLVTGSAVQPVTVPTPTVDGTLVSIKVADGATASVTLPASLSLSGVSTVTAGQDFQWFWNAATTTWSIE